MYQALYRKYRPLTFSDVCGQDHIAKTLKNQVNSVRLSHAYIFTGTRGTGKTTCAKILARAINCQSPVNGDPCNKCHSCASILSGANLDILEIDAASNNGVDNIREIRDETRYTPVDAKRRVYIIDEVHMLSTGAFNALLKILEEPPEHVLFILATTEIHKVPATVLSRCQRFDFKRIPIKYILDRIKCVCKDESIDITDGAADMIARLCDGSLRDALSILDRCCTDRNATVDECTVSACAGEIQSRDCLELLAFVCKGSTASALDKLNEIYSNGCEMSSVFDQLLSCIRDLLILKTSPEKDVWSLTGYGYSKDDLTAVDVSASKLIRFLEIVKSCMADMSRSSNKRIQSDICIISMCMSGSCKQECFAAQPQSSMTVTPPASQSSSSGFLISPKKRFVPEDIKYDDDAWDKIIGTLSNNINVSAFTNIKLSTRAVIDGDVITVVADDFVTASLANDKNVKQSIIDCAKKLMDKSFSVNVIESGQIDETTFENSRKSINNVISNAKKLGVKLDEID